jgi:hypothetical protein
MQILHSLHGQDYNKRFEDQKDTVQLVFDSLMHTFNECGIMTLDVLTQAVHELTNNTKLSSQQIAKRFSRYLDQSKTKYEYVKKERIHLFYKGDSVNEIVQKNCFKLPTSNTNYRFDYSLFSNTIPNKNTKLLSTDFTISI